MRGMDVHARKFNAFRQHLFVPAIIVCVCLLAAVPAFAQVTTADVLGTVTDNSGAVVQNGKVTITNTATNVSRSAQTNAEGEYVFTFLLPGRYSVRVEATGFKAFIGTVTISAGDRARVDAQMQVGGTGETVEVEATTPLLQTDSSTVGATVTQRDVEDLPLPSRNLINLVQLVPGANEAASISGLSSGQRPDDRRQTNSFSVHGHDDILNNELIDGTDNNERIIGTIGVKPSIDAIQEVSVQTDDYAPEGGRTPGAVVNIITKTGTNHFHGSLFEFFQNNAMNARNPFDPSPNPTTPISPQSELRQNDFGGSFGGPIFKDKTFFFAAVEEFRQVAGVQNPIFSSVPTLAQEQAGPAAIVNANPATAGLPVDPIAAKLFTLFPAPNTGAPGATANNFVFDPNRTQFSTTVDARIDHHFDGNNLLYGRYTLNNVTTNLPDNLPAVNVGGTLVSPGSGAFGFSGPAKDVAHNFQLNYTHIFTPALLLELKAAYTRIDNSSNSSNAGKNPASLFGFPSNINFGPSATGLPLILLPNIQALGDSRFIPLEDLNNTFQYNGAVTYNFGRHSIKAGAALIRRQAREVQSDNANGRFNFGLPEDGGNPAADLASFLVGAFTGVARSASLFAPDYRMWEPGFFAQDNWKVRPWLTVNYGFRYDVYTPFTEVHNHISNFDLATGQVLIAGVNGVSDTAGIKTDYSNFSPRVGFAASLGHGMVVRGGFGLTYFPGNYTSNAALKNPPFTSNFGPNCGSPLAVQLETAAAAAGQIQQSQVQVSCATIAGAPTSLAAGIPVPVGPDVNSTVGLSYSAVQLDLKSGSVDQFNLMVEKQFGQNVLTVGYVGDIGHHLPMTLNNVNVPNPTGLTPAQIQNLTTKPFPNVGGIGDYISEGSSTYHALQVSFQRRYSKGITIGSNYTWSHSIDDTTTLSFEGQEGWGNEDPFDVHGFETANSDLDLRHRFVAYTTYELPFGKNFSGMRKTIFGGWQTNAILVWNSGSPFTITDNFTGNSQNVFPGAVGASGPDRPLQIAPAELPNPSISEWFNRNAFVIPGPGVFGNAPRNGFFGPHFRHFDFSFFKDFPLKESVRLQFRTEIFNITNTPNYFIANNQNSDSTTNLVPLQGTAPNPAFGQIIRTSPNYTPRAIQLALKLLF
ncbi:MAG TPA: TonB-dependent receptor [Candidatus Angelobacter sp.]|nr:TonB-dependent receptor [Candidatus Angelobacter sp.]